MRKAGLLAVLVVLVASLGTAASAYAIGDTVQVTLSTDTGNTGGCELRNALAAVIDNTTENGCTVSDVNGTEDHVTFAPSVTGPIVLTAGEIAINDPESDLAIEGPGMNQLTVSGNDASRIFNVNSPGTQVIVSGLSLVHGKAPVVGSQAQGGAIEAHSQLTLNDVKLANSASTVAASSPGGLNADGGGIHATASLTLNQSVVTGNTVTANQSGTGAGEARGGGIFAEGDLDLTDSTVSGNHATAATAGMSAAQATGGIRSDTRIEMTGSTISGNVASATSTGTSGFAIARGGLLELGGMNVAPGVVEQSTIAGNTASASAPATAIEAGGMDIETDTTIRSSTIALNGPDTATADGANIRVAGGDSEIENTIIAGPRGGGMNCSNGTITSNGFNDDSSPAGASCLATPLATDLTVDPLFAAAGLAPNGGLTQTIALQPTSPVIDQGTNADLDQPNQDQRGASFLRPVDFSGLPNAGNGTDIGAFEVQQACTGFTQATPSTPCSTTPPPTPSPSQPAPAAKKKCKKTKKKGKKASVAKKKCKKKKHKK
jgi:hypothetical protein